MSNDIRPVSVKRSSFASVCNVMAQVVIRFSTEDSLFIETDRYQRRELIRNGISYCERKG